MLTKKKREREEERERGEARGRMNWSKEEGLDWKRRAPGRVQGEEGRRSANYWE